MLYSVSGSPVAVEELAKLAAPLVRAEKKRASLTSAYRRVTAAAVIELLDWSLEMLSWKEPAVQHLWGWDEYVTGSLWIWQLGERSAQVLGRKPDAVELSAISQGMSGWNVRLEDVIRPCRKAA